MNLSKDLSKIKFVGFDLDGTLTDGGFYYLGDGKWGQRFSVKDGYGIKLLQRAGIEVGFITNSKFESARERAKMLAVEEAHFGIHDKITVWNEIVARKGLSPEETAYMGDDLPDIPILKIAGFSATVPDAEEYITECCDYVCKRPTGNGAAREFIDLILKAKS
ncbi:MAG: HAD hydrolase family protein [Deltaproteobacteria bacterium]|nr:HAD hydrolase family protein [Deltaproteobacteria bacterium]